MNKTILVVGVSVVSAAAGAFAGYSYALKKVNAEVESILDAEIDKIKNEYRVLRKVDYATPQEAAAEKLSQDALEALENPTEITTNELERIAKGLRYDHMFRGTKDEGLPQKVREEVFGTPPGPRNEVIFAEVTEELNMIPEQPQEGVSEMVRVQPAAPKRPKPYAISKQDFFHSEDNYDQIQFTYFVGGEPGEETMINDRDEVVTDLNNLIGVANLSKFGELSEDPNVLYVRNDILERDFEIVLHTGHPSEFVAGFEPRRRKPNRRQDADE